MDRVSKASAPQTRINAVHALLEIARAVGELEGEGGRCMQMCWGIDEKIESIVKMMDHVERAAVLDKIEEIGQPLENDDTVYGIPDIARYIRKSLKRKSNESSK